MSLKVRFVLAHCPDEGGRKPFPTAVALFFWPFLATCLKSFCNSVGFLLLLVALQNDILNIKENHECAFEHFCTWQPRCF